MTRFCRGLLLLTLGACTAGELDRGAPAGVPLEVVATGGRSFARIGPLAEDPSGGAWARITPSTGAWVSRSWQAIDTPRPYTVVSPDGSCVGKVIAVLELAREIGVHDGRTAETSEVWDAVEIAGCPSFEGDRRLGLDGRVSDAKWLMLRPGDRVAEERVDEEGRSIGALRTGSRDFRIVEDLEGGLSAIALERREMP